MNLKNFYEVASAAIDDFLEYGFDSKDRLEMWTARLANAAQSSLAPLGVIENLVRSQLDRAFKRELTKLAHGQVSQFTLANIKPKLHAELQRRILAAAGLIRFNRDASIARTLQRFAGWASSVPAGGTEIQKRREVKTQVKKGISGLPFEERRVIIDQGHKLAAAVNNIVATDGGAVALMWHHVKEQNYDARPEHLARDGRVFILRDSWADENGLIKGVYYDTVDAVAEAPFCRCSAVYQFNLRDLPDENLTRKGKEALLEARRVLAS